MDCQRYNQFDGIELHATEFLPTVNESLKWRELFWLPQAPPAILTTVREAFSKNHWPAGTDSLRDNVDKLFDEAERLIGTLPEDSPTVTLRATAQKLYPLLWKHGRAEPGQANRDYVSPFELHKRNHYQYVFFEIGDDVFSLPKAMATAAACEVVFRLVWASGHPKVGKIVGDTYENAVFLACQEKEPSVLKNIVYVADGKRLEIDVAVPSTTELVLFETKAKVLTTQSRSGDIVAVIADLTKSYLSMLQQLVRHEHNIKGGLTPLTQSGECIDSLRVTKIVVSPLSFGPASDKLLSSSLLRSMTSARLEAVTQDQETTDTLQSFNQKVVDILIELQEFALDDNGELNLFEYMHNVFWLDLGELLYILERGRSVSQAFAPLKSVTFASRDFWTEASFVDQQGLTAKDWYPYSVARGAGSTE